MTERRQPLNLKQIQAEGWVDRYVRNELNEADTEAFEHFMLDHPEVQDQVLTAMTLKQGLPQALSAIEKSGTGASWFTRLLGGGLQPAFSLAGAALAVTFAVLFVIANTEVNQLEDRISALQGPQGDIATAYLPQVRSASAAAFEPVAVVPEKSSGWALLQLELGYAEADRFDVAIQMWGSGNTVARIEKVQRSEDDLLIVAVPARKLSAGDYMAIVRSGEQTVAEFPFSVD